ncbi:MAG: hypothetical protein U1F35_17675 [Steroidobacteraceae bacterium]
MVEEGQSIHTLSEGMKRRVMIAKALAHEPRASCSSVEPCGCGRRAAARPVGDGARPARSRRDHVLTTHYIEEAEEMADRVGVANKGRSSWWRTRPR